MCADKHRRNAQRQLCVFLPEGCLAVADPRVDLHPCKSACAGGIKKAERKDLEKGPGERGERRKRERAQNCFYRLFIFKQHLTFFEQKMNNTDRFLVKSSVGFQSPSVHPKPGSQASTARGDPLSASSSRTRGTHLSAASPSQGSVPRAGSAPHTRSGRLGTGPCFSLFGNLYEVRRSGGLIRSLPPRSGGPPRSYRETAPHAPSILWEQDNY